MKLDEAGGQVATLPVLFIMAIVLLLKYFAPKYGFNDFGPCDPAWPCGELYSGRATQPVLQREVRVVLRVVCVVPRTIFSGDASFYAHKGSWSPLSPILIYLSHDYPSKFFPVAAAVPCFITSRTNLYYISLILFISLRTL